MSPWPVIVAIVRADRDRRRRGAPDPGRHPDLGAVHQVAQQSLRRSIATGTSALQAINAYDPFGRPAGGHRSTTRRPGSPPTGRLSTVWPTEHYDSTFASLGKPGVGLILDAQRSVQLHQLGISTGTPGFTAEIQAGDSATGPFDTVVGQSQTRDRRNAVRRSLRRSVPLLPDLDHRASAEPARFAQINAVNAN